ncbi:hypothetical protein [Mycobacteroides abscessus]|uniref:hypothetical protein n=1 Tax=Mycobacteroides abscessus TaxID=36809 RepID=UPI0021041FF3|nr:hypothetical protein [Mycobacteroides abscessus]
MPSNTATDSGAQHPGWVLRLPGGAPYEYLRYHPKRRPTAESAFKRFRRWRKVREDLIAKGYTVTAGSLIEIYTHTTTARIPA